MQPAAPADCRHEARSRKVLVMREATETRLGARGGDPPELEEGRLAVANPIVRQGTKTVVYCFLLIVGPVTWNGYVRLFPNVGEEGEGCMLFTYRC